MICLLFQPRVVFQCSLLSSRHFKSCAFMYICFNSFSAHNLGQKNITGQTQSNFSSPNIIFYQPSPQKGNFELNSTPRVMVRPEKGLLLPTSKIGNLSRIIKVFYFMPCIIIPNMVHTLKKGPCARPEVFVSHNSVI